MGKLYRGFAEVIYHSIPYIILVVVALDMLFFTSHFKLPMSAYNPIFGGEGYLRSVVGYSPKMEVIGLIMGVNLGMLGLAIPRFISSFNRA